MSRERLYVLVPAATNVVGFCVASWRRNLVVVAVILLTLAVGLKSVRAQTPAHQLFVYDGAAGIGWTNTWGAGLWAPDNYAPATDPLQSVNYAAAAPGRPGTVIEVALGEPPERPWAFTPLTSGLPGFYLNEIKTVEFDVYFEPDCTDADRVWFVLNDFGRTQEVPLLIDLIPGWAAMSTAQRYGQWHHVSVNLAALQPHDPDVSRLVFYHLGEGLAHLLVTDITLGWDDDLTAPAVTTLTNAINANNGLQNVTFTTTEMTVYRIEYGVGDFTNHVQGDYHDWKLSHSVDLPEMVPGVTNKYRLMLLDHHMLPLTEANLGVTTNYVYVPVTVAVPGTNPPPAVPQHYFAVYDGTAGGDWTNGWVAGLWAPDNYDPATDPYHSVNYAMSAPGQAGHSIEVTLGEPPERPWALAPSGTWNSGYYLNEIRTLEFDIYFPADCTDAEALSFILNDAGRATEPLVVDYIPGWFTMSHSQRYGHWYHVAIDLARLHPLDYSISRFMIYHLGSGLAHCYLANVKFGLVDRITPPVITPTSTNLSLDYRQLTLGFVTDEATLSRVDYGASNYDQTIPGAGGDWNTVHAATLTNLVPGMTYQYHILAWDHRMNTNATPNQSVYTGNFTVPPEPTVPPTLSGLRATDIRGSRVTLIWTNERPCTARITCHKDGGDDLIRSLPSFAASQAFILDLLEPHTAYTATVLSTDAFGLATTQSVDFITGGASTPTVTISVNPAQTHTISPWIYGLNSYQNYAATLPNLPLNRAGGNRWTAYNWENNASNAGNDWYFESDDYLSPSDTPAEAIRSWIAGDRARGNASLMTVPMLGYVAADKKGFVNVNDTNHVASRFKQVVYQKGAAFSNPPVTNDAYVYMDEFLATLRGDFSGDIFADPVTPTFVSLDNEPDLWSSTHYEIQPKMIAPADFIAKSISLATCLKSLDPAMQLFGPVNYGFYGLLSWQGAPGYSPDYWFVDNYLAAMKAASDTAGKRLLDVFDFHWYSAAMAGNDNVGALTNSILTTAQIQAIVQSPRSFWDTNYTEQSWIASYFGGPIAILPRIQSKIDANWPGTKLAITEYDNGGDDHIAGAIAQADTLGIFGSQGLYAASMWPMSGYLPFILGAYRMYRDYDGNLSTFGDTSLAAVSSATTNVAAYVSRDSTRAGRYVIVALNRSFDSQDVAFDGLAAAGTARVYRMEGTNAIPAYVGQVPAQLSSWVVTLPPLSVSTIELTSPSTNATFASWLALNFLPAEQTNNAISNPYADPDHAGLPNVVRYAFNLPARGSVSGIATVVPRIASVGGQSRLEIDFPRRTSAADLSYIVESSPNLSDWSPVATFAPGTPAEVTVQDVVPMVSATRRFLRVRVAYQP